MTFTQVPVAGTYKLADGSPAAGQVRFTPTAPMHNGGVVIAAPVVAELDGAGVLSTTLAATDDTGTLPVGVGYRVELLVAGQPAHSYLIVVPHATVDTLDLADVVPATLTAAAVDTLTQAQADALYQPIGGDYYTPVTMTALSGTVTPNAALGYGPHRYTATADIALAAPAGGTDGNPVEVQITASGGARAVTLPNSLDPVTIPSGETWWGHFSYDNQGSQDRWLLDDSGSGSGGGAVDSVNGRTGVVTGLAEATHVHAFADITSGTVPIAQLPTGSTGSTVAFGNHTHAEADVTGLTAALAGKAATSHTHGVTDLTATGTKDGTKFLRDDNTWQVPAGGSSLTVQEEGSALTARPTLNFVGRAVTAADNSGSTRTDVTILDTPPVHAVGNSGTALTVDAATTSGPVKTITMTGNCTFTFSAVTTGRLITMDLLLTQDGTGSRTATWPAAVKWSGGTPTLSTTAAARDWLTFSTPDGGTTWYGAVVGKGFA